MTARTLRLLLGFLAGFTLISVLPKLPAIVAALEPKLPAMVAALEDPDIAGPVGEMLMASGLAGMIGVGLISLLRWWGARPARPTRVRTRGPAETVGDLGRLIQAASREGGRVPELARRFHLAQDAIRTAIRREVTSPAARKGTSFRSRQPLLPAKPAAQALPPHRTPYRALA